LESSVHAEHGRKTAPNRADWISSQEFDDVLKTLRPMALAALTNTAPRDGPGHYATNARAERVNGAAEPQQYPQLFLSSFFDVFFVASSSAASLSVGLSHSSCLPQHQAKRTVLGVLAGRQILRCPALSTHGPVLSYGPRCAQRAHPAAASSLLNAAHHLSVDGFGAVLGTRGKRCSRADQRKRTVVCRGARCKEMPQK
jgi:hypothetical protein